MSLMTSAFLDTGWGRPSFFITFDSDMGMGHGVSFVHDPIRVMPLTNGSELCGVGETGDLG